MLENNCNIHHQMMVYRQLMNSLIYEKKTPDQIKDKSEEICELAKNIFSFDNDETAKVVSEYIQRIALTKPGRTLLKALIKHHVTIPVKSGHEFLFTNKTREIQLCLTPSIEEYAYALSDKRSKICKRPAWVAFAHELIHALHQNSAKDYLSFRNEDILPNMTHLEEQFTIIGFNHLIFSKKNKLNKLDVLSENAFLLALNLPPRINHLSVSKEEIKTCESLSETISQPWSHSPESLTTDSACSERKQLSDHYYEWLEEQFIAIRQIPEKKKEDIDFIVDYLCQYPLALSSVSDKVKSDHTFLYFYIRRDLNRLKEFPKLSNNKEFVLKIIKYYPFEYIGSELYKDKDFILKASKSLGQSRGLKMLYQKIDPLLLNDPEVQTAFRMS